MVFYDLYWTKFGTFQVYRYGDGGFINHDVLRTPSFKPVTQQLLGFYST